MIRLGLRENRTTFQPGDDLEGAVLWQLPTAPERIEVCLLWSTRGKGTEDSAVVETVVFEKPAAADTRPFKIRLPEDPCSLDGRLIAIIWAVEMVVFPNKEFERLEIIIAPGGRAITLPPAIESPTTKDWKARDQTGVF